MLQINLDELRDDKLEGIACELLGVSVELRHAKKDWVEITLVDLKQALQLAYKAGQDSTQRDK